MDSNAAKSTKRVLPRGVSSANNSEGKGRATILEASFGQIEGTRKCKTNFQCTLTPHHKLRVADKEGGSNFSKKSLGNTHVCNMKKGGESYRNHANWEEEQILLSGRGVEMLHFRDRKENTDMGKKPATRN